MSNLLKRGIFSSALLSGGVPTGSTTFKLSDDSQKAFVQDSASLDITKGAVSIWAYMKDLNEHQFIKKNNGASYNLSNSTEATLNFDGVDQYGTAANDSSLNPTSEMTVAFNVHPYSSRFILGKYDADSNEGWYIDSDNNGEIGFVIYTASGVNSIPTGIEIPNTQFSHIAVSYNSSTGSVKIYVNGILRLTDTDAGRGDITPAISQTFDVASLRTTGFSSSYEEMDISLLMFYDSELSQSRIDELQTYQEDPTNYTQTNLVMGIPFNNSSLSPNDDITSNGNDFTLTNSPSYSGEDYAGAYSIYFNGTNFEMQINIGGIIRTLTASAISPMINTFYCLNFDYDGTTIKFYVNDVERASQVQIGSILSSSAGVTIGGYSNSDLALAVVYNAEIGTSGINELNTPKDPSLYTQTNMVLGLPLNDGAASPLVDTSGNSNDAELFGDPLPDFTGAKLNIEQGGPAEADYNTFLFNGTNQWADAGNVPSNTNITLISWTYQTSRGSSRNYLMGKWDLGPKSFATAITTSGEFGAVMSSNGSTTTLNWNSTYIVPLNTWVMTALTYDGSTVRVYENGVLKDSVAYPNGIGSSAADFLIGASAAGVFNHFIGSMTTCYYYSDAKSASDLVDLYNLGLIPYFETIPASLKTNLVAFWEMNSRDDTFDDLSGNGYDATKEGGLTDNGQIETFASYSGS